MQNYLLRRAGDSGYRGGFISHYLIQVIYPPGLTRGIVSCAQNSLIGTTCGLSLLITSPHRFGLSSGAAVLICGLARGYDLAVGGAFRRGGMEKGKRL